MKRTLLFLIALLYSTSAGAIVIEVKKGEIVNLPEPAAHLFIADPEIADIDVRSSNYVYVFGKSVGETTLHALDANGAQIARIDIKVVYNTAGVDKILSEVLPGAAVKLSSLDNGVVIQGNVNTPEDAQKVMSIASSIVGDGANIVNAMKVRGSDQVMVRVKIAEVARSELKNFGINLSSLMTKGTLQFGFLSGDITPDGNNARLNMQPGRFNITGVIDALENEGLVKTLAEPNLTARSGDSASFIAGGEYPIPVPQDNGTTTIEYKEFGVRLGFTPIVLSDNRISLQVAPEVSSITSSAVTIEGNNIPTLSTRKASTTVELASGESFAIAGLMRSDSTNDISKFPWLGDLPVLGSLFRSNDFQTNETELVIMVTPYIVRGVQDSDKIILPTDGLEVPNDFERLLLGKLYVEKPAGAGKQSHSLAKYRLNGEAGFILEE